MRLTKQTNYAIRMLIYCAANENAALDGRLTRLSEVAGAYRLSEAFLAKILRPLVEAGLVETVRGRKGGIRLARDPGTITLLEVVRLMEENFAMAECFEGGDDGVPDCPLVPCCGLSSALREALDAFFAVLDRHTIADAARPRGVGALLGLEVDGIRADA